MKTQTFERMKQNEIYKPAVRFINCLLNECIPLYAIHTNDWESSPRSFVTLETPYPYYSYKKFSIPRLGDEAVKRAVNFWNKGGK